MKKKLLFFLFLTIQLAGFSTVHTIENAGTSFVPDAITITLGDTVKFTLESIHNAVEVSQATWDADGTTALANGFSLGKGGGTVLPAKLTVGTHYYVCTPHASMGMKGTIIVKAPNGINENQVTQSISIFPSPAIDFITVKGEKTLGLTYSIVGIDGKQVLSGKLNFDETRISIQRLAGGTYYFVAEGIEKKAFTVIQP